MPAADSAPDAVSCASPYHFWDEAATCLRQDWGFRAWSAAEATCEADGDGCHLVVVSSEAELAAVRELAGLGHLWVGLSDKVDDGVWRWVTGAVEAMEPEPFDFGDCARGRAVGIELEVPCISPEQSICECDGHVASIY